MTASRGLPDRPGDGPPPAPAPAEVGWGLGDAFAALGIAFVVGIIGSVVVAVASGNVDTPTEELPLWVVALGQIPLWAGYAGVPLFVSYRKGSGPRRDFTLYGRARDLPLGLLAGGLTQFPLIPMLYVPILWLIGDRDVSAAARELTDKADGWSVLLLVLVVVVGAPVIEELYFRGMLLKALDRRFGSRTALVGSSAIFAAVHLQPLLLPALFAFGLVAGLLVQRTGRLAPAIWAHVAFNGVTVFALLALE